ncbi:MAG: Phosphoglycerate mutase [Thermoleophilia bacterium]|nr:Phosphoglycerate mutase [Thermoleophilia bacterium]
MPPSDIYLVRHGQSEWNAAGRWQGQADPELSSLGREQAQQLAGAFTDHGVTHVVTSDLQRALETAQPVAERLGLEPLVDPDVREIDVGSWSGMTRDEIQADDADALELYFQGKRGWTGGETYAEHETRCDRAALRLANLDSDGGIVVVTHGGTIRALVLALLEIDHAHRRRLASLGHTSITHLTRDASGWRLRAYNAPLSAFRVSE